MMDIVMVGSGGCMRELAWQILEDNRIEKKWNIMGYVDNKHPKSDEDIIVSEHRISYLGNDEYLMNMQEDINVVISIGNSALREKIAKKYLQNSRIHFPNVILKSANVCSDLQVGQGCIVTMDSRISTNVKIGDFLFMNTGSMVCHDGIVGNFVTFSPRSQIAGAVTIGDRTEIGMGATVIQCLKIGNDVIIGAGSVIIENIDDDCTVVGVPARKV